MHPSRSISLVLAALLAASATAFAPATAGVEPIEGPVPLDQGVVINAPYSMQIPVVLDDAAVVDIAVNSAAIADAGEAGAAGVFGFVLVDDVGEPVVAVLSSPLRTEGVDLGPTTFGRGAEAGLVAADLEAGLDETCVRCIVAAGSYDLIVVAAYGAATVSVEVEEAQSPVVVDDETARVSFPSAEVFHSSRDTWDFFDDRIDGPSAGFQFTGQSQVCSGCTLPPTLLLHDALVEDADPAVSAASVTVCTGEGPNRAEDCDQQPMTATPAGRSVAVRHVRNVPTTDRLDSFVEVLGGGVDRRPRIRTGVAVILLPEISSGSATAERNVRLVDLTAKDARS